MNITELSFNELMIDDVKTAKMVELLLRRIFGIGSFMTATNKKFGTIAFRFWSTEEEFNDIIETIEKEVNHWDSEYQELLLDQE